MSRPIVSGTILHVATLDTGGITYSGREYLAVAETPDAALAAIYRAWTRDGGRRRTREAHGVDLRTPADLNEWHGIKLAAVPLGSGRRVDL